MNLRKDIADIPEHPDPCRIVEDICREYGLVQTFRTTLRSYPGSTHWHFKQGKERGTLEITFWPKQRLLWLSSRVGRDADWIPGVMERVEAGIRGGLGI